VDRILFEFGKATITPEGEKILKKVGEILKNIQGKQIRIVGHTDNIPLCQNIGISSHQIGSFLALVLQQ